MTGDFSELCKRGASSVMILLLGSVASMLLACTPPSLPPSVTLSPGRTVTPSATRTPTAVPTAASVAIPTPTPLPESVLLAPMNYQWQTFNNCGPASIAILLGYYDVWITQQQVNEQVEPGPSVCEIRDYMAQHGLTARAYDTPPSIEPVRRLLANGIPVIAGQRLSCANQIGHYRVIKGYDDALRAFTSDDPLREMGEDYVIGYNTFALLSREGAFVAVYAPEQDELVRSLMGELRMSEVLECPPG